MAFFVSVLSTMVLITLAPCANGLSKSYATRIWLSPTASLSFSAQRAKNQIDLALRLKAGAAAGTVSWLGIGIAEPSGGGMRGADIFTVQFQSASTCVPVNRNVPYVGFPLSAAPTAFPVPDAKNTTETWKLVACERGADGSVSLEVTRLLNVPAEGNPGDRSITAGQQQVLHAFGNTFTYHSLNRFSTEVTFFNDAANPPRPEPTGVDGTIVLSGDSNSAKDNPVTCFEMKAPTPPSGRMVVAVEAKVTSRAVTSILVYGCRDSAFFANFNGKAVCTTRSSSLLGLNQDAKCNTLFYSWGPNVGRLVLPPEAGIPLDTTNQRIVMEITMDANKAAYTAGDAIVTLSYTDTARRFKAGTLPIGEPGLLWTGPVKSNIAVPFVCSGQCTKFFNRTVNIFAAHMVSGRYGHQLVIREANADGGNGSTILEADFYTQSVQKYHYFPKPVQLAPGRALMMLCTHDLAKYTGMKRLFYGRRAENEQCAAYLHYWPMQEREKGDGSLFYCGFGFHDGRGGNLCGAGYRKDNTVATEEEGAECFPGAARVRMRDGSTREMRDLQVGDEVLVGDGGFSRVFMFTHRVKEGRFRFVQIGTNSRRVRLSAGHLLYANGMLKKAADVRVGDQLRLADGEEDEVREVTEVEADGLYNPQTVHGDIIVDGVTASCYTDAVPAKAAHALLAPLRGLLGRLAPVVSASLDGSSWRRDVGAFAFRRWRTTTQA